MVIGSDLDGRKDVPEMWIGEHETAKFRLVVLNELRSRGVQDILICCVDNLWGFNEVIAACFPEAQVQKYVVHQIRNFVRYISYKNIKKVLADLKLIYAAEAEPPALEALDGFAAVWGGKCPSKHQLLADKLGGTSGLFKYPPEIRKIICTINMTESCHHQLRKAAKGKSIFPNDVSLQKMPYLAAMDVIRK
jgi:putative transposase